MSDELADQQIKSKFVTIPCHKSKTNHSFAFAEIEKNSTVCLYTAALRSLARHSIIEEDNGG